MEPRDAYITGECMDMCPLAEINMREKENLLHILEVVPGTEKGNKPKVDRTKVVKSFCRSAAGKSMQDPNNLRPPKVLLMTVNYLLGEVILNTRVPWYATYDFIMDRLRAVRQDMIIQNMSIAHSICILQPLVRFYAYASYRLCEEPLSIYDPYMNRTHLQECLKRLLCLYDECENLYDQKEILGDSYFRQELLNIRPEFEALYLVLNLGDTTALTRSLNLHKIWRNPLVNLALTLSLSYYKNNFIRACRLMKNLPVLLMSAASLHLPEIRRRSLQIMSAAYNSKNLRFPGAVLKELFMFSNIEEALEECQYYGLECRDQEVQFVKSSFNQNKTVVQPRHLPLIDEILVADKISSHILK